MPKVIYTLGNVHRDMKTGDDVGGIFRTLQEDGCIGVIITHNPHIAKQCDGILLLRNGQWKWCIYFGNPAPPIVPNKQSSRCADNKPKAK